MKKTLTLLVASCALSTQAGTIYPPSFVVPIRTNITSAIDTTPGTNSTDLQVQGGAGLGATGNNSIVLGGSYNRATNTYSIVVGGISNRSYGRWSFIGNGFAANGAATGNSATNFLSTVVNGEDNQSSGLASFIGNGNDCRVYGLYSAIVDGGQQDVAGVASFIGSGTGNIVGDDTIVDGSGGGDYGVIVGGINNQIHSSASNSFISGGALNETWGNLSFVIGATNKVHGLRSGAVGQNLSSTTDDSLDLGTADATKMTIDNVMITVRSPLSSNSRITNTVLTASQLMGTDANKALTTVTVSSGLSLSGGNLTTSTATTLSTYAAGTVYTFTGSSALVHFGTTDPSVTLATAGTYLLLANVGVKYNAATYAGAQTVTVKLRRTNNTAADLANASRAIELPVLTTYTGGDAITLPPLVYTATAGDIVQIFGLLSATPAAGSVTAENAEIIAVRIY